MRFDVWYQRRGDNAWYCLWSSVDWSTACRRVINARAMGRKAKILPEGSARPCETD